MTLTAHALTTWATVAGELSLSLTDARQPQIERMINAVSSALETAALGRCFEFQPAIVEYVKGFGGSVIILDRTPIKSIARVDLVGSDGTVALTYDPVSYQLSNAKAGFLFNARGDWGSSISTAASSGWPWTGQSGDDIRGTQMPGTERPAIRVIYDAGWITPAQAATMGATSEVPSDLEEAAIIAVEALVARRGRSRDVQSESVFGSAQITYRQPDTIGGILPEEVLAVARRYARAQ